MRFRDATAVISAVLGEYSDPREAAKAAVLACDLVLDGMNRGEAIMTLLDLDPSHHP